MIRLSHIDDRGRLVKGIRGEKVVSKDTPAHGHDGKRSQANFDKELPPVQIGAIVCRFRIVFLVWHSTHLLR